MSFDRKFSKSAALVADYGGEEGIRTLDAGLPHTPLAGERLRPLGHLSICGDTEGVGGFQAN